MISVDPGEHCFWAAWSTIDGGLQAVGRWPCVEIHEDDTLVIEDQVVYTQGPHRTRNPESIIVLAHLAGDVAHVFGGPKSDRVKWVKPRQWKGNTPKPRSAKQWKSYAIQRLVHEALDAHELGIYTVQLAQLSEGERHDLADAVGLGLWELGRLPQPRTESPRRAARMAALQETLKRQAG